MVLETFFGALVLSLFSEAEESPPSDGFRSGARYGEDEGDSSPASLEAGRSDLVLACSQGWLPPFDPAARRGHSSDETGEIYNRGTRARCIRREIAPDADAAAEIRLLDSAIPEAEHAAERGLFVYRSAAPRGNGARRWAVYCLSELPLDEVARPLGLTRIL